jgi:(E)-benzylidenesuccinyl-CoA hydratase
MPSDPPAAGRVVIDRADGFAFVILDRPAKRNALTLSMRAALAEALTELDEDDAIQVVVLTGAGGAFCAGVDLAEGAAAIDSNAASEGPPPVTAPLDGMRKPVIAAIDGPAMGGGLELALACDIRVASERATFGLPEVRIGSLPGSGGIQRLWRAVPAGVAARMALSAEPIGAQQALAVGLVSDVTSPEELAAVVTSLATRIAANAPLSLLAAKKSLRAAAELPLSAGLALDRSLWVSLASTEDRAEGRAAFREGRPPRFRGR